jgi:hypothetical protein
MLVKTMKIDMKEPILPKDQQDEVEALIKYLALSGTSAEILRLTANSLFMAGQRKGINEMMDVIYKPTK